MFNPFMQSFLILILGFPMATLFSAWVVATFIWYPLVKKSEKENKAFPPIPYARRYPFMNKELVKDNSGAILGQGLVLEHTEFGYILMGYVYQTGAFEYWADTNIQYKILEAVARKFVQSFRCEHLYINRYEALRKKWKEIQDEIKKDKEEEKIEAEPETESVFAILKAVAHKQKKKKRALICDKVNTFIKRGRLNECPFFKMPSKSTKKFNFDDWKKLLL